MWYLHETEYYVTIKRNGVLTRAMWLTLENVIESERSQT